MVAVHKLACMQKQIFYMLGLPELHNRILQKLPNWRFRRGTNETEIQNVNDKEEKGEDENSFNNFLSANK